MTDETGRLRYLTAERVDTPVGRLGDAPVVSNSDDPLGNVNGVVIDPARRKVRYVVVESRRFLKTRRYLVPFDATRIDPDHKTVRVGIERDDLRDLEDLGVAELPPFSDDDLITALFPPDAA